MARNEFGAKQFIFVLGLVLFFLGAFPYPLSPSPIFDTWRGRIISAGLFCWALSTTL
jgi:hypothetical protein